VTSRSGFATNLRGKYPWPNVVRWQP